MRFDQHLYKLADTLSPLMERSGLKTHIAPYYYRRYPLDPELSNKLEDMDFPDITNSDTDNVAVFTDVYPNPYRTLYLGFLAQSIFNNNNIGSIFIYDNKNFEVCQKKNSNVDCAKCVNQSNEIAELLGLNIYYLTERHTDEIKLPKRLLDNINIYAESAASRKLKLDELNLNNEAHQYLFNEFKNTGKVLWEGLKKLDAQIDFEYIINYTTPRLPKKFAVEYAKEYDKKYIGTTDPAFGKGTGHLFHKGEGPLGNYISDSIWHKLVSRELTTQMESELTEFMGSRTTNTRYQKFVDNTCNVRNSIDFDQSHDIYSMYTHLAWDAAADKLVSRVYNTHRNWVINTIEIFQQSGEQLIVKLHPAEELMDGNITIKQVLDQKFGSIPPNIEILEPDTEISTYDLVQYSDIVLVNTSTVGLESAYLGTPVISVGDAHYAGKGFTHDPKTKEEYRAILDTPTTEFTMTAEEKTKASIYAYNYFVERPFYIDDIIVPKWSDKYDGDIMLAEDADEVLNHEELCRLGESISNWDDDIYMNSVN